MGKPLVVKEFDRLTWDEGIKDIVDIKQEPVGASTKYILPKDKYDELYSFLLSCDEDNEKQKPNDDVSKIYSMSGKGKELVIQNYVGVIELKSGFQVEIWPKVDFDDVTDEEGQNTKNNARTRKIYLDMLCSVMNIPFISSNAANLRVEKMNIIELFIDLFVNAVQDIVKKGLKSQYIGLEDNLNCLKGKMIFKEQIKRNLTHKERFYVAYQDYHIDRPENRLIKSTLQKLQKVSRNGDNVKNLKVLLNVFGDVSLSTNYEKDFSSITMDRSMSYYKTAIDMAKIFLRDKSFTTFADKTLGNAYLFPMETLYEAYVAKMVAKVFDEWNVKAQAAKKLFGESYIRGGENRGSRFLLKPDIYLKNGKNNLVMDTKWKRLLNDEKFHFGIKQGDVYQMFMYAMKFNATDIWLLYPWYAKYEDNENAKYTYGFDKSDKSKELVRYSTELEFINNGALAKKTVNIHAFLIDMADIKGSLEILKNFIS